MISGGVASLIAGSIVYQTSDGYIHNYDVLGYVVAVATLISLGMMYLIDALVKRNQPLAKPEIKW